MLKRLIKLVISFCVYIWDRLSDLGLRLTGRTPRPRAVVLYYHGISEQERAAFARQMALLRAQTEPISCLPGQLAPGKLHAAVSFDDGFVSVLDNALPALRENQIPATIFVPTGYLGTSPGWVKDPAIQNRKETIVNLSQLQQLGNEPLLSIGSHTVTHPRLAALDSSRAKEELESSKKTLEQILNRPVESFSFPHGSFTPEILRIAESVGYKRVFGINPTLAFQNPAEFLTGRVAVNPSDWTIEFVLKLKGAYRWSV